MDSSLGKDYQITILPETNIAPENRRSQKETSIPTIHYSCSMLVSGRVNIIENKFQYHLVCELFSGCDLLTIKIWRKLVSNQKTQKRFSYIYIYTSKNIEEPTFFFHGSRLIPTDLQWLGKSSDSHLWHLRNEASMLKPKHLHISPLKSERPVPPHHFKEPFQTDVDPTKLSKRIRHCCFPKPFSVQEFGGLSRFGSPH